MAWMSLLPVIIQVLPTLVDTIQKLTQKVEEGSPHGGGEAKKAAVVGLVQAGIDAADRFDPDGELLSKEQKSAVSSMVGEAVDVVVGMQNAVGTFKKGE